MPFLERLSRGAMHGIVVLSMLWLGGCAPMSTAKDPLKDRMAAGESTVVLSITGNTGRVTATRSVLVGRLDPAGKTLERLQLQRVVEGVARDTAVFVGVLPRGEYEFDRLDFDLNMFLPINDGTRAILGHFRVEGTGPVDLGRLIFSPTQNGRVALGRSARVQDNAELLQRFAPDYSRLVGKDAAGGWLEGRTLHDKVEEFALGWPEGLYRPTLTPDGRVLAGSRLSTVLERSPGGRWKAIRGSGLATIMDVMPVEDPAMRLVAVGEFSSLWSQQPGTDLLTPIKPGNLPAGNLLFIAGNDKAGWYLALQSGGHVRILRSDRLANGDWKVLREEDVSFSFWSGANQFWGFRTPEGLAYATTKGGLHFLDFGSGQWSSVHAPKDHNWIRLVYNADGSFGALTSPGGGFGGVFASVWLSRDRGASWQEVKTPYNVQVCPPLASGDGKLLLVGGVFSDPSLQQSDDGGKTWGRVAAFNMGATVPFILSPSLYLITEGEATGNFAVRTSGDQGKSWRLEGHTGY